MSFRNEFNSGVTCCEFNLVSTFYPKKRMTAYKRFVISFLPTPHFLKVSEPSEDALTLSCGCMAGSPKVMLGNEGEV